MKYFYLFTLCLLTIAYGQEKVIWQGNVINTIAVTSESSEVQLTEESSILGRFGGLFALGLNVDSVGTHSTVDSSLYFIYYRWTGKWIRSDTLTWSRIISDADWVTTTKWVIPSIHDGWDLVWKSDPTKLIAIEGLPIEMIKVERVDKADTNYSFLLYINR